LFILGGKEVGGLLVITLQFEKRKTNRNRKSTTCAICWLKSVLHEEKRREQENHNVGRSVALPANSMWYVRTSASVHLLAVLNAPAYPTAVDSRSIKLLLALYLLSSIFTVILRQIQCAHINFYQFYKPDQFKRSGQCYFLLSARIRPMNVRTVCLSTKCEMQDCLPFSSLNLLKTKRNLLYISNQSVPRCKHFPPQL
jgi:hypothetical protein